jgi:hypothetical protein
MSGPPPHVNPTETIKWMALKDNTVASPAETVILNNLQVIAKQNQQIMKVMNDVLVNTDRQVKTSS